ncbi:hypothetical protein ACR42D_02545 [Desulfovibrio caledoniensis]
MQRYSIDLVNGTDRTWTMAVYRSIPNAFGRDSDVWKRTQVPPSTTGSLAWEMGVYKASQAMQAELGHEWDIVYRDGVQQLRGDRPLSTGNAQSNASARSEAVPTYWVGLFRDVRADEAIGGGMDVGPIELRFARGSNAAVIDIDGKDDSMEYGTTYFSR